MTDNKVGVVQRHVDDLAVELREEQQPVALAFYSTTGTRGAFKGPGSMSAKARLTLAF